MGCLDSLGQLREQGTEDRHKHSTRTKTNTPWHGRNGGTECSRTAQHVHSTTQAHATCNEQHTAHTHTAARALATHDGQCVHCAIVVPCTCCCVVSVADASGYSGYLCT